MCPKDYVRYRLTGEFAIDVQEASGTLLLDVTHRRWSREVAEAAGIPESWLPRVYESPEICARISEKAAGLTGLKAGTPVAAGAGDQGAGAVGMGILQPGSVSATIGTSGVVFAATAEPTKDPKGRLHTFCHAVPGLWHVMGVTQSGGPEPELAQGDLLRRPELRRAQCGRRKSSRRQRGPGMGALSAGRAHAASRSRGARGLCGHRRQPHRGALCPRGAGGRGLFARRHVHALRRARHSGQRHPTGRRRRARRLWRRIQAGIYGHAVEMLTAEEGGAFGCALMAGVGAGHWENLDEACGQAIEVAQRIEPDPADVAAYKAGYAKWRKLYPALRSLR